MAKGDHAYLMTANILARLSTPNLRDRLTPKEDRVYLRLSDGRGHDVGIIVSHSSPEEILPFLISALKTAGYEGSYRIEDPSLRTQFTALLKSLEPIPNKPSCHKCQKAFRIGDEVVSIGTKGKPKHFHSECYRDLFL